MVNYLQLYCSHYGPGARPFAFILSQNGTLFFDFERKDATYDWIASLDRLLRDMPENDVLYTFNSGFEQKTATPLLSKESLSKLSNSVDLYKEIKARTRIVPYKSYSMESLSHEKVILGSDLHSLLKEGRENEVQEAMKRNIKAMEQIGAAYERLVEEQSASDIWIDAISPSPFTVTGHTNDSLSRYIQRGDALYEEKDGLFRLELQATWLPYDQNTKALVVETDVPIQSMVNSPPGYLIFALGEEVFYSTILEFIHYLRHLSD
ncbi:hypothetical protein PEPCOX59622_00376 [Aedoeadaptatus coxii]|uniref:hypothetical protein n=1 Tax=Aedoeadaptatus coxii TaxID=755172 RepID=UPI0017535736|nr:hypothetical protein [Peptoniphilus coxii]CAC9928662.1 hypothetical protein PEPCOX59622_00376 [Peptoniphilus coxii]